MTTLTKAISRQTGKIISGRAVIVTVAPCGSQSEARIGVRLKGKRTQYVCALSDIYRMAALWHGQKVAEAKKQARKHGVAWRIAKREFDKQNKI